MKTPARLGALLLAATLPVLARGQSTTYTLDPAGGWSKASQPKPGSEEAAIAQARQLIAQGKYAQAETLLDDFIEEHEQSGHPLLPEAYLRRGDARTAQGDEETALRDDYEQIAKLYPACEQFPLAMERELEIALRYLNGLGTKFLGMRIGSGTRIAEEALVRVQERLPGSQLAERAGIELADYYYRIRDLAMAATAYDVFLKNHPRSEYRQRAMQRRVLTAIAGFKGPQYDASSLIEAQYLIRQFARDYPAQAQRVGLSDALSARLDESAAAHLLQTARWYVIRKDPVSARLVLRRLVRKHPGTIAAREAEEFLKELSSPETSTAASSSASGARS